MASSFALDHLTITSDRFADSASLYDAALGTLGLVRLIELTDEEEEDGDVEGIGYGHAEPDIHSGSGSDPDPGLDAEPSPAPDALRIAARLWLVAGQTPTRGLHVAFRATSRGAVEAFFAASVAAGGLPRQQPRRWEIFRTGYYGASIADVHGNVIEAYLDEG